MMIMLGKELSHRKETWTIIIQQLRHIDVNKLNSEIYQTDNNYLMTILEEEEDYFEDVGAYEVQYDDDDVGAYEVQYDDDDVSHFKMIENKHYVVIILKRLKTNTRLVIISKRLNLNIFLNWNLKWLKQNLTLISTYVEIATL